MGSTWKTLLIFSVILLHDNWICLNLLKHAALSSRDFLLMSKENLFIISFYPPFLCQHDFGLLTTGVCITFLLCPIVHMHNNQVPLQPTGLIKACLTTLLLLHMFFFLLVIVEAISCFSKS